MDEILDFQKIDIDFVAKLFAAMTAAIVTSNRLKGQFSKYKLRSIIKSDLEILKTCSEVSLETKQIKDRIDKNINSLYNENPNYFLSSFTDILVSLILFFGFGLWTVKIYTDNLGFSPWMILTTFISIAGLSSMFQEKKRKTIIQTDPVFTINVYNWRGLMKGISMFILFIALTTWIYIVNGFTYWLILTVVFILAGLSLIIQEIEIKTKK